MLGLNVLSKISYKEREELVAYLYRKFRERKGLSREDSYPLIEMIENLIELLEFKITTLFLFKHGFFKYFKKTLM